MENQVEKAACVNPNALIILIGVVFGALIGMVAKESFLGTIGGAFVGFVFAIVFNSVLYKQTPHDR